MKKPICILLAVCFIATLPVSSLAAASDGAVTIAPFYLQIDALITSLSIDGSGKALCAGIVQATNSSNKLSIEVSLQQYKNSEWMTIKSWTGTGPGYMSLEVSGSYYVSSGYSYRVVSTASVYDASGNLLETASKTTSEKTY